MPWMSGIDCTEVSLFGPDQPITLYNEEAASLHWHSNAHGRAVCRHCRN
jgi:hypothetical protein